jgi:hypothetical protein
MSLVDNEMVGQDKEGCSGQMHLKQTSSLVSAVTDKALIAPGRRG